MANLKDIFGQLKTAIVGTKTSNIDKSLDVAVSDIIDLKTNNGKSNYIEILKSLIVKSGLDSNSEIMYGSNIYNSASVFGQHARILRYKNYDAIKTNISYCSRALNVIVDNILSPDDITKTSLEIKPKTFLEDEIGTSGKVNLVKKLIESIKLENNLDLVIKNTLYLGDMFVEVSNTKDVLTSRSYLIENYELNKEPNSIEYILPSKEVLENSYWKGKFKIDFSLYENEKNNSNNPLISKMDKDLENKKEIDYKEIRLIYHNPSNVVKLQSEMFPVCFGYLVFPKYTIEPQQAISDQMINSICSNILRSVEKRVPEVKELKDADNKELKSIISQMIRETDPNKIINIRYIPTNRMQHFQIPSMKFFPYGESIFENVQFLAKMLIAMETAMTIYQINRSVEKRKILVETGFSRDSKQAIEDLKEQFKKRKVSIDNMGSIDTIASQITTFEDVYLPQKDGKAFVDISTFNEGNVDVRNRAEVINFVKNQLISGMNVPPAFLGDESQLCVHLETPIKLVGYKNPRTLLEIINMFTAGEELYTYSYDHESGMIVPGKITWAGKTKLDTEVVKIYLDNDEFVITTPDHLFMLRDGTYKEAKNLQPNDSLMPLYKKIFKGNKTKIGNYEEIYHPGLNQWELEYRSFADYYGFMSEKTNGYHCHHINGKPWDNRENNLIMLTPEEHLVVHSRMKSLTIKEINELIKDRQKLLSLCKSEERYYIETKICKVCGNLFRTLSNVNVVTCSKKCRLEFHKYCGTNSWISRKESLGFQTHITNCAFCGKEIEVTKLNPNIEKFYSCNTNKECTFYVRQLNRNTNNGIKLYCDIEYTTCESCGKMMIWSGDANRKLKTCNNIKCRNISLNKLSVLKKKEMFPKIKLTCRFCGEEFERLQNYLNNIKTEPTCGKQECFNKSMSEINRDRYKNNHIKVKCTYCDKEVEMTEGYRKQIKYPNCGSEECVKKHNIQSFGNQTSYICDWCGKEEKCAVYETNEFKIRGGKYRACNNPHCKEQVHSLNIKLSRALYFNRIEYSNCLVCDKPIIISDNKPYGNTCSKSCQMKYIKNKKYYENNEVEYLNHKVTKVEFLTEKMDTGDITVEKYNNFAVSSGIIIHNSNKAALSEENMLFARTIINHQKYINAQLVELITKIIDITQPDQSLVILDNITICLPTPKSLQFERQSAYTNNIVNLIESLERIGVPREYTKKKYLTDIDWEEIKNYLTGEKIDKTLNLEPEDQNQELGGIGGMNNFNGQAGGIGGF